MIELGLLLGMAVLGGAALAWWNRRACPMDLRPLGLTHQRVQIEVEGQVYTTLLSTTTERHLVLAPPTRNGLPLRFEAGTRVRLTLTAPGGVYTAESHFTDFTREGSHSYLLIANPSCWQVHQRRRHPRVLLSDEVSLEARANGESFIGWVQDVSAGGMRMVAPLPLAAGTLLHLDIPPSLQSARSKAVRTAQVRACKRTLHRSNYLFCLHLAFTDG